MNLDTTRLLLRPFQPEDVDAYAARIYGDPDVMRYLPKRDAPPEERARRNIEYFNDHLTQYPYTAWAVVEKESGELIGHCGLRYIADINETEVLYAFGKDFWGRGYATEAARASVEYGFKQVGLERIIGLAMPANIASCKVLEHCGLKFEKDAHLFDLDLAYYALNRQDYNDKDTAT